MAEDKFYARKFGLKVLTILEDRYSGTYSGGEYTAWPCTRDKIPAGPSEDDVTCAEFWSEANSKYAIGRGATRNAAVADLVRRLKSFGKEDENYGN